MEGQEQECKDAANAKVESSTQPDDGTPNQPQIEQQTESKENGREGGGNRFKRGGKFGRNFSGGRRNNTSGDAEQGAGGFRERAGREQFNRDRDRDSSFVRDREQGGGPRDREFNRDNRGDHGRNSQQDYFREKLYEISGPTHELPPLSTEEKKFNGRNRLYIGNISTESGEEIAKLCTEYGEVTDIFLNREKHFAFVIFDYHANAIKAKNKLDGTTTSGDRQLRIRFSPRASSIRVSNLAPTVTNELLHHGFGVFGEIERSIVLIDERGRSTGVGEIDFVRRKSAMQAVKECTDGCFFLTNSLRPCIAEFFEPVLGDDGYSEKSIQWHSNEYLKDRESGPWIAKENSPEHEFGTKWKQIRELYKQKEEALKKDLAIEEEKLQAQMDFVKYEFETRMLKKQLEEREMFWQQQKMALEEKERMAEQLRMRNEEEMRRREEQIKARLNRRDEELQLRQKEGGYFSSEGNSRRFNEPKPDQWSSGGGMRDSDGQRDNNVGGYWQHEPPIINDNDVASQGSRGGGRSNFLEEPGQVWKRLDEESLHLGSDNLFQRRPNQGGGGDEIIKDNAFQEQQQFGASPGGGGGGQWKRGSWNDDLAYVKRGRF